MTSPVCSSERSDPCPGPSSSLPWNASSISIVASMGTAMLCGLRDMITSENTCSGVRTLPFSSRMEAMVPILFIAMPMQPGLASTCLQTSSVLMPWQSMSPALKSGSLCAFTLRTSAPMALRTWGAESATGPQLQSSTMVHSALSLCRALILEL